MGASCLSAASILRCESLSKIQYLALIIPTGLELIFSTSLILTNRGAGWRHLLLVAEGWTFLALTILDTLSHLLPAARTSITVFRALDIVIGSLSSLPILFYTGFLLFFARGELLNHLPERFRLVSKCALFLFIPPIIALNEVASFVGISYGMVQIGSASVIAIGFKKSEDELVFSFFTSLTLALLAAYQGFNFFLACYRIMTALADQRRIETLSADRNHLFNGTGWIAGGLLLGTIETVIGFAGDGFGEALTRRMIRLLSRACLIIGLVKGMDVLEDFARMRRDMEGISSNRQRGSLPRLLISNPRLSTFRKMSPTAATAFQSPPQAQLWVPGQRVTVNFASGQAPTLEMRFSALELPSPTLLVNNIKARPVTEWLRRPLSHVGSLPSSSPAKQTRPLTIGSNEPPQIYKAFVSHGKSAAPVRSLQLPSFPPEVKSQPRGWRDHPLPSASLSSTSSGSLSSLSSVNAQDIFTRPLPRVALKRMVDREVTTAQFPPPSIIVQSPSEDQLTLGGFLAAPTHTSNILRTAQWVASGIPETPSVDHAQNKHASSDIVSLTNGMPTDMEVLHPFDMEANWVARPVSIDDEFASIERAVTQKVQLTRARSIGSVRKRSTPTPTPSLQNVRDSIPVERMIAPIKSLADSTADLEQQSDSHGKVASPG